MTAAEYQRNWRHRNPEKVKAIKARCSRKHRAKHNEVERAWRARNKAKVKGYGRKRNLASYGLTSAEFESKKQAQHGLCALCGGPPTARELSVDHDLESGRVRDLLCGHCNPALGAFKDSPELLRKAADYIERHRV